MYGLTLPYTNYRGYLFLIKNNSYKAIKLNNKLEISLETFVINQIDSFKSH